MREIYYDEICYPSALAGIKQKAAQERVEVPEAVSINDFDINKVEMGKGFSEGDDIQEFMMSEIQDMQDGDLRYVCLGKLCDAEVGPRKVKVDDNVLTEVCKQKITEFNNILLDDDGEVVAGLDTDESIFKQMKSEEFTRCYFMKSENDIFKFEAAPLKEANEFTSHMAINKYAVYGRI